MPPGRLPPRRPDPRIEQLTADDLRGLRRWVVVTGVWAVAATAIALIALIDSSEGDAQKGADEASARVTRVERELNARIDVLEKRLADLPRSDDVSKLEDRVAKAEGKAAKAATATGDSRKTISDLEDRVKQVEEDAANPPDSGGLEQP